MPHVRCTHPYHAADSDDLEMLLGDVVEVRGRVDDAWYEGRNTRTQLTGLFPLNVRPWRCAMLPL